MYAGFRLENKLCGAIDVYGNIIIEPEYRAVVIAGEFAEVRKNDKWGTLPIIVNEIYLGVYLIAKGFRKAVI